MRRGAFVGEHASSAFVHPSRAVLRKQFSWSINDEKSITDEENSIKVIILQAALFKILCPLFLKKE